MAGHVLVLRGCTLEPLGNYLKGLGVFRLIAEQVDPQARAWWKDGVLHILQSQWRPGGSRTAKDHLGGWLLTRCRFTALVAPWQQGTGYLPHGKRTMGARALAELLKARQSRAEPFREAFRDYAASMGVPLGDDPARWLEAMGSADRNRSDADLLRLLRNRVGSPGTLRWLDAVGMAGGRSRVSDFPAWFPILGRGGGETGGHYIANHQQRVKAALLDDPAANWDRLDASLFGCNHIDALEARALGAMYYPSLMMRPNTGQEFLSNPDRRVNPWDFILLLEGTLVWSIAATRRHAMAAERTSFPFYCRSSLGGSATTGPREVEGAEKSIANGELWCPLWNKPATLPEILKIFGEGRIQIGAKVCTRSSDFALAMAGRGVDRGIAAFYRYSLLKRSGSFGVQDRTTLLAVPHGCFVPCPSPDGTLLAELRGFIVSVAANLADHGHQAKRLTLARIDLERAWFDATMSMASATQRASGETLARLIVAVGSVLRELGKNAAAPGLVKRQRGEALYEKIMAPVGNLSRGWIETIGQTDASSEYRLARAIAGMTAWGQVQVPGRRRPAVEGLYCNLLPVVRPGKAWQWYDPKRYPGLRESSVWSHAAPLEANLAAVLYRRLRDAQRGVGEGLPLGSLYGACFTDLLAFWRKEVDEERLVDLIHGFSLVDTGEGSPPDMDRPRRHHGLTPDPQTGVVGLDADDERPRGLRSIEGRGKRRLLQEQWQAACALPRVYHLLKLCFMGGRLPRRPVEGQTIQPTGDEPFPPRCLDVLTLLQAGRLGSAVDLVVRRLRARGYPCVLCESDLQTLELDLGQCRRLAGMLLIPVSQPGLCAALAIRPQSIR